MSTLIAAAASTWPLTQGVSPPRSTSRQRLSEMDQINPSVLQTNVRGYIEMP